MFRIGENCYGQTLILYWSDYENIFCEVPMANLLGITVDEYIGLLTSYGSDKLGLFKNEDDAKRLVDFLNDKYLLTLKLLGKVA